jgi:hypothetical protein
MTPSSPVSPSLEVHIPISPTVPFLRMVRCLVTSLRHFGGLYADAKVVVTIGDPVIEDKKVRAENPWLEKLGIETRWVPEDLYARDIYYATANQRFCYEYSSDMVLMLDADMLVARPFDDLVMKLFKEQKMGGVIGFACPFDDFSMWERLYAVCDAGPVRAIHQHTGWPYIFPERPRFGPAYFNLGFLMMPSSVATAVGSVIYDLMHRVSSVDESYYRCQFAFGLAVCKLGIPYDCLPLRYNFPNNMELEALHPNEQVSATILHLFAAKIHSIWKAQGVGKRFLYGDDDGIEQLLAREDLAGINKQAQQIFRHIWLDLQS